MDFSIFLANLTNPTLLFFGLGVLAVRIKSDLELPAPTLKFLSLYLLFSIGFKGGHELRMSPFSAEVLIKMLAGVLVSVIIPLYAFFVLKGRFGATNAGAVAAAYGSVSAVIRHSFTNGSVLMVVGSLVIGLISDTKQAEGIKPFTTDIFKGFLALFLLEMGMVTAKRIGSLKKLTRNSLSFAVLFAAFAPLVHGILAALVSRYFISDPGLFLPMALAITFPVNLTLGIPLYRALSASH